MLQYMRSSFLWGGLFLWLFLNGTAFAENTNPCVICSVEQATIHNERCPLSTTWKDTEYYFCEENCKSRFLKAPDKWSQEFALLDKQVVRTPDVLPKFKFPLEPIGSISSDDISGKVVLLNLWANWCQPCLKEMPDLVKLQNEFKDDGLVVMALSFDKTRKVHRDGVEKLDLNFISIFADQTSVQSFLKELGPVKSIPVTFVVDSDGKIVKRLDGAADLVRFRELVRPLLRPPSEVSKGQKTGAFVPS